MNTYRIAGLTVHMDTWGRTLVQAQPYLMEDRDTAQVEVTSIAREMQQMQPHLTLDDCEYISTGQSFAIQLPKFHGMTLHASAMVMDGKAYLISASGGVGKSTHTGLWRQVFGEDRVKILNDDKPALRCEDGVWYAYGTPWSGRDDNSINMRVPLAGIAVLERGEENTIVPLKGMQAVYAILDQTARHKHPGLRRLLMENVANLLESVPIYLLKCNMDPEAAVICHAAMSGEISL